MRGRWFFGLGAHTEWCAPIRSLGVATIELAAALTVTLVMVAVAVSAYRTHSARREVRASLTAVESVQELVTDAFERTGQPPASESEVPAIAIATARHPSVEALTIEHGRINILFGQSADQSLRGRSLSVTPFETMDGDITWLCGHHPPGVGLYPLGLFGGTLPPARPTTTIDRRYLPLECR